MVFRGKALNPKFRVQGWCASKVKWCVGRGFLFGGLGVHQSGRRKVHGVQVPEHAEHTEHLGYICSDVSTLI